MTTQPSTTHAAGNTPSQQKAPNTGDASHPADAAAALRASDKNLLANIIREASIHEELPTAAALLERLNDRINNPPSNEEDAKEQQEAAQRLDDFANNTAMQEAYDESASDADSLILQQRLLNRREMFTAIFSARREENSGGVIVRSTQEQAAHAASAENMSAANAQSPDASADADSTVPEQRIISEADFATLLAETLAEYDDLALLKGLDGGEYYHSPSLLSVTYASIVTGKTVPTAMIADTVRSNSRDYPRPVALEIFEYPPFDLTPELLETHLHAIAVDPNTADIKFVESCVGTIYLYSSQYLDEDYASFLADREDVGMVESP